MTNGLTAAYAVYPPGWVQDTQFIQEVAARGGEGLHYADLYLALACAAGVDEAIATFEREHLSQVKHFVARIDSSEAFADEVTQRLRLRLLVRNEDGPARIATYSARGPLGGWLRVCAVREGRELAGKKRKDEGEDALDAAAEADPEMKWLKERYGAVVSNAFKESLAAMPDEDRLLLKMHYLDGATLEEVASILRVSRATAARNLAKTRQILATAVRERLREQLGADTAIADSLVAFVRSRIELDLRSHLT